MAASTSNYDGQSLPDNHRRISAEVMTDDDYAKDLALHLNQLRHERTLCDVTIIVDHRRFEAHKVVLSAASSYFSAMFTSGFQESSQSEINIPEGSSEAFEKLLDFAYTGGLPLSATTIMDVISLACYMQFNKAIPLCSSFLDNAYEDTSIQLPDAFSILTLATSHQLPSIKKSSRNYLAKHFVKFSQMSCFLEEASVEYVKSVLKRKDLGVFAKEEQILTALVAWLKKDWENRKSHAASLLKHIRLGLVPSSNLKSVIGTDIGDLSECRETIDEVEKCLASKNSSKEPMSVRFPDQFATRGTVTTVLAIDPSAPVTQCYDYLHGWEELNNFPRVPFDEPFLDHGLIVADKELYVAGGSYKVHVVVDSYMMATLHLDHFFRYDRSHNDWMRLAPMITKRSSFTMVHLSDHIYAIGGRGGLSCRLQPNVERYSLLTEEWEEVAPVPVLFKSPCAVAYNNKILMYGVLQSNVLGTLLVYDPESNTWTNLLTEVLTEASIRRGSNFRPVLVVENGECYRVMYVGNVAQVNRLILQLDNTAIFTCRLGSPHNVLDQTKVSYNPQAGAFCINKKVFVNLRRYIHKLDMSVESTSVPDGKSSDNEEEEDSEAGAPGGLDLLTWEEMNCWENYTACVDFTFDKYRLL